MCKVSIIISINQFLLVYFLKKDSSRPSQVARKMKNIINKYNQLQKYEKKRIQQGDG